MIVDNITVIFADGTRYRFAGTSATELILSPVFLKFFSICILIFVFLHQRSDLADLEVWERIATYLAISIADVAWLLFSIRITILLRNWGVIRSVYTPLISVPTIIFSESAIQLMHTSVLNVPLSLSSVHLEYIVQVMVVIFLMDMLFGNFVALQHPSFVKQDKPFATPKASAVTDPAPSATTLGASDQTSGDEAIEAPDTDLDANPEPPTSDETQNADKILILKDEEFPVQDILLMRIEDHYLRIETTDTNALLRYKISDAVKQIDPDIGVQVNRSVWVSKSAIEAVYRTPSYGAEIVLTNGNEFTVSRSRMSGVLECLERWNIEIKRRE